MARGFLDEQMAGQFELFSAFVRDELRPALLESSSEDFGTFLSPISS